MVERECELRNGKWRTEIRDEEMYILRRTFYV